MNMSIRCASISTIRTIRIGVCSVTSIAVVISSMLGMHSSCHAQATVASRRSVAGPDAAFVAQVEQAVRSRHYAVLDATVIDSEPECGPMGTRCNRLDIHEVLKAYRSAQGVYFVPTLIYSSWKKGALGIEKGKRYLIVVKDLSSLFAAKHRSGDESDEAIVVRVREATKDLAVYGAASDLDEALNRGWDSNGVRTLMADGAVDPSAFGLSISELRGLKTDDAWIGVLRCEGFRLRDVGHVEWSTVERLSGPELQGRLRLIRAYDGDGMSGDYKVRAPYVPLEETCFTWFVAAVKLVDGEMRIVRKAPLIGLDDGCVRKIRSWIREIDGAESRPQSRPGQGSKG